MRRLISLVAAAAVIVPLIVSARAQTPPTPSFASKVVLDNDRVRVQRLTVPVGFREGLQVVPNDQMAIQMTPGELEVVINGQKTAGKVETGAVFYVPKNAPHQFSNIGSAPYDTLVVMLK